MTNLIRKRSLLKKSIFYLMIISLNLSILITTSYSKQYLGDLLNLLNGHFFLPQQFQCRVQVLTVDHGLVEAYGSYTTCTFNPLSGQSCSETMCTPTYYNFPFEKLDE